MLRAIYNSDFFILWIGCKSTYVYILRNFKGIVPFALKLIKKKILRLQWNQYFEKSFLHHRYNFRMLSFCVCFFKHFYIFHRCISLHPYGLQCWYFFFPYMRSYTKDTWAYGPNINVYVTIARIHQVSLICEGAPSFY